MKPLRFLLLSIFLSSLTAQGSAAIPNVDALHAWYRSDAGLQTRSGVVTGWQSSDPTPAGKTLERIVGAPRVWRVQTKEGAKSVLRLDGTSALWQASAEWGSVPAPRTVLCFARITNGAAGVLFDGATPNSSATAILQGSTPGWRVLRFDQATSRLAGFVLGASASHKDRIKCDVAEVLVFSRALSPAELEEHSKYLVQKWGTPSDLPQTEQHSEVGTLATQLLRKHGQEKVHTYRRPGIATTPTGTLLAVFDQRRDNAAELPSDIDIGLLRSTDQGETWQPMQTILDYDGTEPGAKGNGVSAPCIFVDRQTGRVFVAALWSHGDRAWNGSGPGLASSETGQLVLTHSDDEGLSWSAPRNITPQIKLPEWRLCLQGPGRGLQLKDGTLVLPAQFRDAAGAPRAFLLFSRDHGVHWSASPPATPEDCPTSEAQAAELPDGSVLFSMRDESRSGQRAWCRFDPKTQSWGRHWFALPDPSCQASLLSLKDGSLLFCNPASSKSRSTLTVRTSLDNGQTWSDGRLVDPRTSGSSCMTLLRDGRIALFYEGESGLYFSRFWPENTNLAAVPLPHEGGATEPVWLSSRHSKKLDSVKKAAPDLLFLGDTLVQGWEDAGSRIWKQYYEHRNAASLGFAEDSTQHLIWRIDQGALDGLNPKLIVLHIGTHNLKNRDFAPSQIAGGIGAVLERIIQKWPSCKILLLGILPRDLLAGGDLRRKGEEVNAQLPPLADGKRIFLLNINHVFLKSDGAFVHQISTDQLHLTTQGYALWAEAIETALQNLLEAAP